jgi:catechol 2,3-dioxygenase-like lactoylglutathione lyase family enzyme
MNIRLEVVILPVADVDRSKAFYEQAGFVCDTDHDGGEHFRVVQMRPPGSRCSVSFGNGITTQGPPGSIGGLHLVVEDIEAAIADLRSRGIEVSDPFHFGAEGQTPGLHPERLSYGSFAQFEDPDGNGFLLQEITQPAR